MQKTIQMCYFVILILDVCKKKPQFLILSAQTVCLAEIII